MKLLGIAKLTVLALMVGALSAQEIPADSEDTKTLESGLVYSVLTPGDGKRTPKPHELVRVHYTGWLNDGSVFDSSRSRGTPAVFPLNGVIAGWTEGLGYMSKGARFKLTIPSKLGYGERGRPGIPANSDLIFDVELLEIQPECPPLDDENATTTESGVKYRKLVGGEGAVKGEDDLPVYEFAWFSDEGSLQEGTWKNGMTLPPHIVERLACLDEIGKQRVGDSWRIDIPPGQGLTPVHQNRTEHWVFTLKELKQALPLPEFKAPTDDELTTTKSGLQYTVLKHGGEGDMPEIGDSVTVHYAGWLEDGTLFDNSFRRGEPSTFQLGRVIRGWNEGLALMTPGSTYVFKIPAELGYGARGSAPSIPPDATLIFHVELISFEK